MCELCRKTPCDTRCPNYVSPLAEHYCSICNEGIYTGEEYIKNDNGDYVHYECISGTRDLLNWLGINVCLMNEE